MKITKELDEEGCYSELTVGELKQIIKDLPDDTEVKIRVCKNPLGNIVEAGWADFTTYGYFGIDIPCLVIEPAYISSLSQEKDIKKRKADIPKQ